jgi:hypothetical protein
MVASTRRSGDHAAQRRADVPASPLGVLADLHPPYVIASAVVVGDAVGVYAAFGIVYIVSPLVGVLFSMAMR